MLFYVASLFTLLRQRNQKERERKNPLSLFLFSANGVCACAKLEYYFAVFDLAELARLEINAVYAQSLVF